ncbi:hypothetical protein SAMN05444410_10864 [Hydrobacter penzbergensis]|uniref:Uncharacterized protein n=1 Tax=Hydrobacter penzbergensis TaxID=1235997 RepID=A0A8X8LBM1_9BACT|nr:hypothetical protein [Hydrobacter penzbergensis]SDX02407.1 hypothetical protein SAMN05444410_10864 [Hydrobacter penzbergensis]
MLSKVSWSDYAVCMLVILCLYYLLIGCVYRKDLLHWWKRKNGS